MLNTPLHSLSTKHVCTDIQLSRKQEKTESIYLNIHLNPVANKGKSTQNLISLFGGVKVPVRITMNLLAASFIFSSLLSVSAAREAAPGAGRFRAAVYEHEMVLSNAQLRAAALSNTGAALRLPRHPLLQGGRRQPHGGQPRGVGDTGVDMYNVCTYTIYTI